MTKHDEVISHAKQIYAIGYQDGVKATNVDCGVVWEERIEDIKADIYGIKTQKLYEYVSKDNIIDTVIEIINKHIGGKQCSTS